MQRVILVAALAALSLSSANAQCGKKIKWISNKLESIDPAGELLRTMEEEFIVTVNKQEILLEHPAENSEDLKFVVKSDSCKWEQPFKKGKTVYKGEFSRQDGRTSDGTLTIEGNGEKITITIALEAMEGRTARLIIAKYEELP